MGTHKVSSAWSRGSRRSVFTRAFIDGVASRFEAGSSTPPRSASEWIVDLAAFAFAVALGAGLLASTWSQHSTTMAVLDSLLGCVACGALWMRRSQTWAVAVLVVVVSAFSSLGAGAALVGAYSVAVYCSTRRVVVIALLALLASLIYAAIYVKAGSSYDLRSLLVGLLGVAVAIGWGLFAHARRELIASLTEKARWVESEQQERVLSARRAERELIAREMHDVLAHRLSLLSLHAGVLEFRDDASRDEVKQAAHVIRDSAHAALNELREVITMLREPSAQIDDTYLAPPVATLADVPALAEESRHAGMAVELSMVGELADMTSSAVGRTVYRIVQEGLTNAHKHAPECSVRIDITPEPPDGLLVTVLTSPRLGAVPAAAAVPGPGSGTGLTGLAERASLVGGRLEHVRTTEGGFLLRATLPRGS